MTKTPVTRAIDFYVYVFAGVTAGSGTWYLGYSATQWHWASLVIGALQAVLVTCSMILVDELLQKLKNYEEMTE